MKVSDKIKELPPDAIHEMTLLSKDVEDVSFFSWARPDEDTPEHIKEFAIKAMQDGLVSKYSETNGISELREEVAKKLNEFNKIDARPSEVIITVGAIEAISAALMTFLDPGDEVILPSPNYSTHLRQVIVFGGKPVYVPTLEDEGFKLDLDGIRNAVTDKTKAILFCTPCNPTGAVYSEHQQRELAKIALENNILIISDEAYEHFTYDGKKHFSIGSIPQVKNNVISCFTFTKTYAMTGWRVGYLHAQEDIISQVEKSHIPLSICAPVISQYAALGALRGSQDCVEEFRSKYERSRDLMCERLDGLSDYFDYCKPEGAYLMFPKVLIDGWQDDSGGFSKELLLKAKVSATPGVAFGPTGEGHIRLSFCLPEDMVNKAFDRIERFCAEI